MPIFSLRYLQTQNELVIPISTPEDGDEVTPKRIASMQQANSSYQKAKDCNKNVTYRTNSISEISENKIFNVGVKELNVQKIKLPTLDSLKSLPKKKLFKNTFSLDNCEYYFIHIISIIIFLLGDWEIAHYIL